MISDGQMKQAREIREWVGPMRREDGRIDASAVARESTLRDKYGLPQWIAELDAPGNGQGRMEDQNQPEDQIRDPEDTMPAQGWVDITALSMARRITPPGLWLNPDAGRFPAPRKDSTMAPVEIGHAEIRQDFGHAAESAHRIDQFALADDKARLEELEGLPLRDLRELHHTAQGVEDWHNQGARDARELSRTIGQLLRTAGEEIDPQAATNTVQVLR